MAEFDQYAAQYETLHEQNLGLLGEDTRYFDEQKMRELKAYLVEKERPLDPIVLDFGCGIGKTAQHLAHHMPQSKYYGIDMSTESIDVARIRNPKSVFQAFDGLTIPARDESFDIVFLSGVVHHIPPPTRGAVFAEIRRVLKPGGFIFAVEHNPLNPLTRYLVATCELDCDAHLIGRGPLIKGLIRAGFQTPHWRYVIFFPKRLRALLGEKLERRLWWLPLGGQYWVAGHR